MIYDLSDYKKQVKELKNKFTIVCKDYKEDSWIQKIDFELEKQLQKYTPSLMFYGVYNAGKSSLINALVGEEIAKVGDIPTTASIQRIDWNGFTLVDTPGIVANDEHTEIAEQEIKRNDIVLFVVDDLGTFENRAVSTAILKIIRTGKPLIIVVNQKQASMKGAEAKKQVTTKIIENIKTLAYKQGMKNPEEITKAFDMLSVNAKAAFVAKTQYSWDSDEFKMLWNASEIEDLISLIERQLKKSQGINLIKPAIMILKEAIEDVRQQLERAIAVGTDEAYQNSLREIQAKKANLYKNIVLMGKNEINAYGDRIYAAVMQGNNNEELGQVLQQKLQKIIKDQFESMNLQLENSLNLYEANLQVTNNIDIHAVKNIKFELPETEGSDGTDFWRMLTDLSIMSSQLPKIPVKTIIPPIPGGPIPLLIPIISTLIELFKSKKKQEKEKERLQESIDAHNEKIQAAINEKIAMIFEINNKIRTEITKLEHSYVQTAEILVDQAFEEMVKELDEIFHIKKQENQKLEQDIDTLKALHKHIYNIEINLD